MGNRSLLNLDHAQPLANWALLNCQMVWAYEGQVAPSVARSRYGGHPTSVWLLQQGSVRLRFPDGADDVYTPGHWIMGRESVGEQDFSPDARIISLRFYAEWPNGAPLFNRSRTLTIPRNSVDGQALMNSARELVEFSESIQAESRTRLLELRGSLGTHLELRRLESNWLATYAQVMEHQGLEPQRMELGDPRLDRALRELQTRPLAEPMRERDLARAAGLSVSQLNRLFASKVGHTPIELWETRRLTRARTLLSGTAQSIKSIAFELGFSSPPHFTNWFRNKTKLPPKVYRERLREV